MTSKRLLGAFSAAALCLGSLPASGQEANASTVASEGPTGSDYAVYVHGLHVLNVSASYQLQPWGYGATTHLESAGFASWFLKMRITTQAQGHFTENRISPISYESSGFSRGTVRHVKLVYHDGTPSVEILEPRENDREQVPSDQLAHTVDTLSGVAHLLHTLTTTGKCNGTEMVFDGLRLTHMTIHGPVTDAIPQDHGELYSGPALRCDFIGQQVAGFVKDSPNRNKMSQPKPGAVWFKQVDGFGLVPVRIEIEHPKLGHVTVVMQQAPRH
ncbi:DUF3108 domain-containing protein [Gluconobacter wancherniae]|uniref:DUF3108 domain-containing protein n=1 Tax=Gluconobacter wancherniae TaxID=1307955 RepID=UPI002010EF2E|nr:DUF3108 domain-containing protein [Gluconobacter wancherniae]